MSNDIGEAEKIVRYLIEIRVIHVFNKEDNICTYLKEISQYKWPKGALLECHDVAAKFINQIILPDEHLYFSYFKWVVLWLRVRQIYRYAEKDRSDVLQEFLTIKRLLKTGDIHRSGHQWANPLSEIYHLYAHYGDTRKSVCYEERFKDLRLDESFLQGSFPKKLKDKSKVEQCFSYYLYHLPDSLFISRYKFATTDTLNTDNYQNRKYQVNDIKGIEYRYRNKGQWSQWRVATMYRIGDCIND
uniref:Uncharacterized protein n=1 Tax=Panagrolaimus davidi TaxID=227884 RepID=A0A914QF31_9BILA